MKFFRNNWKHLLIILGVLNGSVLATTLTILSESKSALIKAICQYIPAPSWAIELILFLLINILVVLMWLGIQCWQERRSRLDDGTMKIAIDDDARSNRIGDFQLLRENANKDILIMGIGMSSVSADNSIVDLLQQEKNVSFLIMDPDVLIEPAEEFSDELCQQFSKAGIAIDNRKFSDYYLKRDYRQIITTSMANLKKIVDDQNKRYANCGDKAKWREGKIIVKKYSFHVPMNVTISDIDTKDSKLVAEFCLPFSARRIRTKLSQGEVKTLIEKQIIQLWKKANLVLYSGWITDTSTL